MRAIICLTTCEYEEVRVMVIFDAHNEADNQSISNAGAILFTILFSRDIISDQNDPYDCALLQYQ